MTGDADSAFLTHASEAAFDLGEDRFRLTTLRIHPRSVAFTETEGPAQPPVYREGPPPGTGREARRTYDWQPAAAAPAWMNMAWLLDDLAAWVGQMAEDHVVLAGVESPEPDWCDVLVRDGDTPYRARLALAARDEVLDYPGMYLRELFAEGRHRDHLAENGTLVDLRGVL
ncbi:hypothetical protein [Streptomyces sp. SID11385]|uniref:hypothetical protein n=1 Tax=Streptomyces sp. SID11385 TaxID=2706031 RepID=UPI0013CD6AF0|nr:hypothetical protein [Streptomyces sp. SID11385]NEA44558.1 hypothetical protein [Streptomyces sp. SID11385]